MATSWRINQTLIDKTTITSTEVEIVGATVIKSYKGSKEFIKFDKGDTAGVLSVFGYPNAEYPSIQDALDIVSKSNMYIASPFKGGKYGGVFVTPNGTIPFVNGYSTKEISDMTAVACEETVGTGDDVVTTFTYDLKYPTRVTTSSIKIFSGSTDIGITIDEDGKITDEGSVLAEGSTYVDGKLTLVFTIAPSDSIVAKYTMNMEDTYFVLFDKFQQSDDLKVKVSKSTEVDGAFQLNVYQYNPMDAEYEEVSQSPYTFGLTDTAKDNMGSNIYIDNILNDFQYYFTPVIQNSVVTDFVDDTEAVLLVGGDRGTEVTGADVAGIYDALQDTNKYEVSFAFDPTCSSECITKFETLRDSYQKYTRFLYCTTNASAEAIIAEPLTYNGGVTANRGLYCYCLTWGIHKDVYQGNDFACSNLGLIAGKLVDVLTVGGGVPAWTQGEDGVSGILGSSVTKLLQDANETKLEKLDKLGFNPVVMDNTYGAMIVSWRTRQVKETVFSYIGQSSLADTILNLVVKNVLPLRIGKLIDQTAYTEVQSGIDTICRTYQKWLEDWYVLCDDTNNTGDTKNAQKLMIALGIIFKGYASKIYFNVTVLKNGVDIEEAIKNG